MPIYSELIGDKEILQRVEGLRAVTILGCGGCVNESLAYSRGYPISKIAMDGQGTKHYVPYGVAEESTRIRELLESCGIDVKVRILQENEFVCMVSDAEQKRFRKGIPDSEAILAICCPAGQVGIRRIVGRGERIIPLVRVRGILQYHYEEDIEQGLKYLVKERSAVVKNSFNPGENSEN